jgi:hypothetical protein
MSASGKDMFRGIGFGMVRPFVVASERVLCCYEVLLFLAKGLSGAPLLLRRASHPPPSAI